MDRRRYAPGVVWAVERDGLTLIDTRTGAVERLGYPAAAVWDLMGRESGIHSLTSKISAITSMNYAEAQAFVEACFREWAQAGLVVECDTDG